MSVHCPARFCALLFGLVLSFHAGQSRAAISSLSGDIEQIAPPASVVIQNLTSSDFLRIFREQMNFTLTSDLGVDFTLAKVYDGTGDLPTTHPTISAGTAIDSYFVHGDSLGSALVQFDGSITFDTEILGVILTNKIGTASNPGSKLLETSDGILGYVGTAYPSAGNTNRQVELGASLSGADQLELSADRRTLTLHLSVAEAIDQLRVITAPSLTTAAVPEPSSAILVLGLSAAWALIAGRARIGTR